METGSRFFLLFSLLALFREPGIAIPVGRGPGARPAVACPLFPPVLLCCFEVTKINTDLRKEGLYLEGLLQDWERKYCCKRRGLLQ